MADGRTKERHHRRWAGITHQIQWEKGKLIVRYKRKGLYHPNVMGSFTWLSRVVSRRDTKA